MKFSLFFWIAMTLASTVSRAEMIASCKRRNILVNSAFTWAEISRTKENQMMFQYGTGIDTQMIEVYFDSPVEQDSPSEFHHKDNAYELKVWMVDNKLSFDLTAGQKTVSKRNFVCKKPTPVATP
jgi:hypothetical protein